MDQDEPPRRKGREPQPFERAIDRISQSQLATGNRVVLLRDGTENYPAWLKAIASARTRICFENYFVADDEVGKEFADALIERAAAGVEVRFLYDWLGSWGTAGPRYWSKLRAAGVEVRCYNPPRLSAPLAWVHRDHRKLVTVDGRIGFVSGICVAKEWLGDPSRDRPPWRDTGVSIEGPAVAQLDRAFADSWAAAGGRFDCGQLLNSAGEMPAGSTPIRVFGERPGRFETYRVDQLITSVSRRRVWMTDAYFVGTPSYVRGLVDARADGIDVRVLVPGSSNIRSVQALARAHYRPLLEAGIRVFEWNGPMLHAKTAVYDGRWSRVGSSNLNLASWMSNYELDVLIEDRDFAAQMEAAYLEDLGNATEIILEAGKVRSHAPVDDDVERKGTGRILAASALALGSRSGEVLSAVRPLSHSERQLSLAFGLLLLSLAAIMLLLPLIVIVPVAAALIWGGVSMLLKSWRLKDPSSEA